MKGKETMENEERETAREADEATLDEGGEEAASQAAGVHEHEEILAAERSTAEEPTAEELTTEDGLLRDLEELQDRHLRLAAEFENYRKRTRRELAEMRKRSQADLVRGLLDVLDDLARVAHHAVPDATVASLMEGVSLVEAKMRKALGDAGLERIEAAGQRFDPNLHEALAARATTDPEMDDVVSNVILDGYTFADILVRPARVEVAKYTPGGPSPGVEATEGEGA